jgi:hypothetical protein
MTDKDIQISDNRILQLWLHKNKLNGADGILDFARALLKEAQSNCNKFCGEQECKENQPNCKRLK